jgi:hypothetical protein
MDGMDDRSEQPSRDLSYDPAAEVVQLCQELIGIDTSNYGTDDGPGERKAAEYVAALLDEAGIESQVIEGGPVGPTSWRAGVVATAAPRCCCTATSTSYPPRRRTGRSTRSAERSGTGPCGAAVPST